LTGFVTAFEVAATEAFVLAAADGEASLAEGVTTEALGLADSEREGTCSPADVSGSLALGAEWVQEPASMAMARTAAGSRRGRLTRGG
jgi:hypothetical protein